MHPWNTTQISPQNFNSCPYPKEKPQPAHSTPLFHHVTLTLRTAGTLQELLSHMELPAHPVYLQTFVPLPTGLDPSWSTASASSSPTPASTGPWLKGLSRTGAPTPRGCGWGAATDCRNSQWTVRGSNPCPENSLGHGTFRISQILLCHSRNKSLTKLNHWTLSWAIQTFTPRWLKGLFNIKMFFNIKVLFEIKLLFKIRCYSVLNNQEMKWELLTTTSAM